MTIRALSIAASALAALERRMDLIADNLAHANTAGFKRSRESFSESPADVGVRSSAADRVFEAGALRGTSRELDLAIDGDGFFRVTLPGGEAAYTRSGHLELDREGNLVTPEGYPLDPPVFIPPGFSRITIDPAGRVRGVHPMSPDELQDLGQIGLSRFPSPSGLVSAGGALFGGADAAGERQDGPPGEGLGWIRQGYLEQSNVDPLRELALLVETQRAFELNSRMVRAVDEVLQSVTSLRRKS